MAWNLPIVSYKTGQTSMLPQVGMLNMTLPPLKIPDNTLAQKNIFTAKPFFNATKTLDENVLSSFFKNNINNQASAPDFSLDISIKEQPIILSDNDKNTSEENQILVKEEVISSEEIKESPEILLQRIFKGTNPEDIILSSHVEEIDESDKKRLSVFFPEATSEIQIGEPQAYSVFVPYTKNSIFRIYAKTEKEKNDIIRDIINLKKKIPVTKKHIEMPEGKEKITITDIEEIKNIFGKTLGYQSKSNTYIIDSIKGEKKCIQEVNVGTPKSNTIISIDNDNLKYGLSPKDNFDGYVKNLLIFCCYDYDYNTVITDYDDNGKAHSTYIFEDEEKRTIISKDHATYYFDRSSILKSVKNDDEEFWLDRNGNIVQSTDNKNCNNRESDYSVSRDDIITGKITGDVMNKKEDSLCDKNGIVIYSFDRTWKKGDNLTQEFYYHTVNNTGWIDIQVKNNILNIMAYNPNCYLAASCSADGQFEISTSDNSIIQSYSDKEGIKTSTCQTKQAMRQIITTKDSTITNFTLQDAEGNIIADTSNEKYFKEDGSGYIQIKKINGKIFAYDVSIDEKEQLIVTSAIQKPDGTFIIKDKCGADCYGHEGLCLFMTGKLRKMLLKTDAQGIISAIKNNVRINISDRYSCNGYGDIVKVDGEHLIYGENSGINTFNIEHELGHLADHLYGIVYNKSVRDIYEKELLKVDNYDKYWLQYFLDSSQGTINGLAEIVAEVNAMQNSNNLNSNDVNCLIRTAMFQKYFPETIAAIIKEMAATLTTEEQ